MGASITKEEKAAIRYINERILKKIEQYQGPTEVCKLFNFVFWQPDWIGKSENSGRIPDWIKNSNAMPSSG